MAGQRLLSYTEIETAQTCFARHAFRYTGHLTEGDALLRRSIPTRLSEGRAWGIAVAKWHTGPRTLLRGLEAAEGVYASLAADEAQMLERGIRVSADEQVAVAAHLLDLLEHYTTTSDPLGNLTRLEDEVVVALPSRTGRKHSTRYRYQCFIDGWTYDDDGHPWLLEFKLRSRLSSVDLVQKSRQLRWYSWALREAKGIEPVGVLLDERLNLAPQDPRLVKARRKGDGIDGYVPSHATDQVTTSERYEYVCRYYGVEPSRETAEHLDRRVWQQRVPILFRPGELDEAGEELVSAAKLIRDLDSGALYPIRNARAALCGGCDFQSICSAPGDRLFVDTLFERVVPKRKREEVAA
jgi:hypothetical protein